MQVFFEHLQWIDANMQLLASPYHLCVCNNMRTAEWIFMAFAVRKFHWKYFNHFSFVKNHTKIVYIITWRPTCVSAHISITICYKFIKVKHVSDKHPKEDWRLKQCSKSSMLFTQNVKVFEIVKENIWQNSYILHMLGSFVSLQNTVKIIQSIHLPSWTKLLQHHILFL
jgi:hypothetical protein